jgi:hypothetical protein
MEPGIPVPSATLIQQAIQFLHAFHVMNIINQTWTGNTTMRTVIHTKALPVCSAILKDQKTINEIFQYHIAAYHLLH